MRNWKRWRHPVRPIVHNPVSNLKLASGFARVQDMLMAGIPVSLGTDGACSNNSLDMFETMKLAAILAKGCTGDATAVPAMKALGMATVEGARIFRTPGPGNDGSRSSRRHDCPGSGRTQSVPDLQ